MSGRYLTYEQAREVAAALAAGEDVGPVTMLLLGEFLVGDGFHVGLFGLVESLVKERQQTPEVTNDEPAID